MPLLQNGIDYRSKEGQEEYDRIFSKVISEYDAVVLTDAVSGQNSSKCAVFIRDDDIAVVNLQKGTRVTLFRHSPGVSDFYDSIWDQVRK